MLIPAIGAVAGAALKPSNPLQGALLGAAAGYTGGQALGLGALPTAASGGGLTMGAGGVTGLTSGTGAAINAGANAANTGLYSLGGTTAGLSAVPAVTPIASSIPGASYSLAAAPSVANYSLVAPSAVTSVPSPSFMDSASIMGKTAYENPIALTQTVGSVNSLLQPDQQMATAPVVPVTARNKLANYDPMAALDPYKPSAIGNSQFSLI
jgi:hypothetical protein